MDLLGIKNLRSHPFQLKLHKHLSNTLQCYFVNGEFRYMDNDLYIYSYFPEDKSICYNIEFLDIDKSMTTITLSEMANDIFISHNIEFNSIRIPRLKLKSKLFIDFKL